MATLIIGAMVIGALIFASFRIFKKQKSNGCSGCPGCSQNIKCHK